MNFKGPTFGLALSSILLVLGCKETTHSSALLKEKQFVTADTLKPTPRKRMSRFDAMAEQAINEGYHGVFTSSGKQDGLFPIAKTGVSTQPIMAAANAFIQTLSSTEQTTVLHALESTEWRHWANVDNGIFNRAGLSVKMMSKTQRIALFKLLEEALSAKGLQLSKDIMKTDQTLKELNNNSDSLDEDLYFITIMGTPSMDSPWGFQFEGHHLAINYFIVGDQVVMTPTFMGAEPVITTSGKYKGNTLFQDEQNLGLQFMQSLSTSQQTQAMLSEDKGRNNIEAEAFSDNTTLDFEGFKASEMTEQQQSALLHLAGQYIHNMRDGHAQIKMADIEKHLNSTYFAWRGTTDNNAVFYYRIHSPVVLIEFDHQGPVGVRGKGRGPTRNHIHTIVRTPNGNDYGKDYLKQHLESHKH